MMSYVELARRIKPINHYLAVLLVMLCTGEKCMTSWKEKLWIHCIYRMEGLGTRLSYLNWFLHMVSREHVKLT